MLHTPFPWLCIPTCCLYMCLKQSCACTRRRVQGLTSHARTSPSGSTRRAAPAHAHIRLRALSDRRETPPRSHLPGFALFQHGGFRLTHASVTLDPLPPGAPSERVRREAARELYGAARCVAWRGRLILPLALHAGTRRVRLLASPSPPPVLRACAALTSRSPKMVARG